MALSGLMKGPVLAKASPKRISGRYQFHDGFDRAALRRATSDATASPPFAKWPPERVQVPAQPRTHARTMVAMAVVSIFEGGSTNPASVDPLAFGMRVTHGIPEVTG